MKNAESDTEIKVKPPAAHVCESCGNVEKITQLSLMSSRLDRCWECGSNRIRIDSWKNAQELIEGNSR